MTIHKLSYEVKKTTLSNYNLLNYIHPMYQLNKSDGPMTNHRLNEILITFVNTIFIKWTMMCGVIWYQTILYHTG